MFGNQSSFKAKLPEDVIALDTIKRKLKLVSVQTIQKLYDVLMDP